MSPSERLAKKQSNLFFFIMVVGGLVLAGIAKDFVFWLWSYGYEFELFELLANNDGSWDDSWGPMFSAAWVRVFEPDLSLYRTVFFDDQTKFQYPPISLLPFMLLVQLGVETESFYYYMGYVSMLFVVGIGYVTYRIVVSAGQRIFDDCYVDGNLQKVIVFIVIFAGTFTFYPVVFGVYLGQIQVLLDLLICLAFLAWVNDRKVAAGVFVAFAALVKPQYLLLLIWSLIRGERKFTWGMVAVFVPAGIVSLAVFGFQEHLDYVAVISHIGKHGEVYWPNQSMNGLLNRLLSGLDPLEFSVAEFAPYNSVVYFGTLMSTIALLFFGLLFRHSRNSAMENNMSKQNSVLDLSTMLVVATIASPIAWEHHYGVTWPVIVIAFMAAVGVCRRRRDWYALAGLAFLSGGYFLISNYFYFIKVKKTLSLPPWNIAQSYIYFGGLMLLAALVILRLLNSASARRVSGGGARTE